MKIIPVILCGGVGSRLWPLSREDNPKQFLRLNQQRSLFQETVLRTQNSATFDRPIVVCQERHKFKVAGELEEIGIEPLALILEPCSRNTAPAIAAATCFVSQRLGADRTMLVLPSDHVIDDGEAFVDCVRQCQPFASERMITFGIAPTEPATGYGYIKAGDVLSGSSELHSVESFTEKPDERTAGAFLQSGGYFWNAGIFLFGAELYLNELEALNAAIFAAASQAVAKSEDIGHGFIRLHAESFAAAEDLSIDYAVFEKTTKAAVCPMQINWTDLGSWQSLYSYLKPSADASGNVTVGQHVICFSGKNNLLHAQNDIHLVVNKVDNLAVICTQDAVFITDRRHAEDTKLVYKHLEATQASVTSNTNKSYRPWGHYEVILREDGYCVKRISVLPLQQISLQYHHHRNEHWVITKGSAVVTKGDQVLHLKANESVYIAVGEVHKIANQTTELLEFIEVQTGEQLSEDDIVRLEDKYGRVVAKC